MDVVESLRVEGLAAQLYAASHGNGHVWWHLMRDDLKERWRRVAVEKIAEFDRKYSFKETK